jgi:pyridoxine 5-phosphate synthase
VSARRLIAELDAVGWLRERCELSEPSPLTAAALARLGGASGVALRLASDPAASPLRDARLLRELELHHFELVLPASSGGLKVALEIRPDCVTWTGESEHSAAPDPIDLLVGGAQLGALVRALGEARIRSSVLVPPDPAQLKAAHRIGLSSARLAVHGHTYSERAEPPLRGAEDCARMGAKLGLAVGVVGAADREQLRALAAIEGISEFCVGPALIAQALLLGMERAAREFVACLHGAH